MKKITVAFYAVLLSLSLSAQKPAAIDSTKFFTDESLINVTLSTDIKGLQNSKGDEAYQPGSVTFHFSDSTAINETVRVAARGHFRRETCIIPPILVNFRNESSPQLTSLHKLKLVIGCASGNADEQLILKEYLAYKIYNILEPMSFRARLVKMNYVDTRSRMKSFSQYAFFIEDDDNLAERLGLDTRPKTQVLTENADRRIMTMVAVYEYFISNGDWSVPANHNVKLLYKKNEPAYPFVVPYDFDHSGFVNAGYALPNELLGTEKVTERVYRGFPRTEAELEEVFAIFKAKRAEINALIMNFSPLTLRNRKDLVDYLDDFYRTIGSKGYVRSIFIDNARKQ